MKRIILMIILIASPLIAQESSKKQNNKKWVEASLFTTVYGGTDFYNINVPLVSVGVDLALGGKVYFYTKSVFNYRGEHQLTPLAGMISLENQIGFGFYLFDLRYVNTPKPWSMVMNFSGGIGNNVGALDSETVIENTYYFPLELAFNTRYHFSDKTALMFGLAFGVSIARTYTPFIYGLTVGLTF